MTVVKMSILSKEIYRFKARSVKILTVLSIELCPRIAKVILSKKNKAWKYRIFKIEISRSMAQACKNIHGEVK